VSQNENTPQDIAQEDAATTPEAPEAKPYVARHSRPGKGRHSRSARMAAPDDAAFVEQGEKGEQAAPEPPMGEATPTAPEPAPADPSATVMVSPAQMAAEAAPTSTGPAADATVVVPAGAMAAEAAPDALPEELPFSDVLDTTAAPDAFPEGDGLLVDAEDPLGIATPATPVAVAAAVAPATTALPRRSLDDLPSVDETVARPMGTVSQLDQYGYTQTPQRPDVTMTPDDLGVMSASDFQRKGPSAGKVAGIIICVLFALLVATYLGGVWFFKSHYLPKTTINGDDVSFEDTSYAADLLESALDGYQIHVTGDNLDTTITAEQANMEIDGEALAKAAHAKQNPWLWPLELTRSHRLSQDVTATVDADALTSLLTEPVNTANGSAAQPKDAYVTYNEETSRYEIVPEEYGTAIVLEQAVDEVSERMEQLKDDAALDASSLSSPEVTQDDEKLNKQVETANTILSASIRLKLGDATVKTIDASTLKQYITFADDGTASLDEEAMLEWGKGDLSQELDTVGTERTYTRPDGKEITVSGGTYGWNINSAELIPQVITAAEAGEDTTIDIPCKSSASTWTSQSGADWGKRWVDVDLSEQHAYFYDNGTLIWESDIVSGDPTEDHDTPTGVYYVNNKTNDETLRGPKDEETGEYEWESEVTYWMPFIDNTVGLHDASWRSSFGGTIYQGYGSHGCINLPSDKAKTLFDLIEVGDVVITHN